MNKDIFRGFEIEVTSICNIHCKFCPRDKFTRERGKMTRETMKKVFQWLPRNLGVAISGMGEPLLNENLVDFIALLKRKNILVFLKTNGILLTPDLYDRLIEAGVMHIQVSLVLPKDQHRSEEMYKPLFEKLKANLKYISAQNSDNVSISYVECEEHVHKEVQLIEKEIGKPVIFSKLHSRGGTLYELERDIVPTISFCELFPRITYVTWNGNILGCCHDIKAESMMGNIFDLSLEEVYKLKEDKKNKSDWFSMCKSCDDVFRFTASEKLENNGLT